VYTRISGFASWIQNGICDISSDPPSSCPTSVNPTRAPMMAPSTIRPISTSPTTMAPSIVGKTKEPISRSYPTTLPTFHTLPAMPVTASLTPTTSRPSRNFFSLKQQPTISPTNGRDKPIQGNEVPYVSPICERINYDAINLSVRRGNPNNKKKRKSKREKGNDDYDDDEYNDLCTTANNLKVDRSSMNDVTIKSMKSHNKRQRKKRGWLFRSPQTNSNAKPIESVIPTGSTSSSSSDSLEFRVDVSNIFVRYKSKVQGNVS
jgi:hypothetical protein